LIKKINHVVRGDLPYYILSLTFSSIKQEFRDKFIINNLGIWRGKEYKNWIDHEIKIKTSNTFLNSLRKITGILKKIISKVI